MAFRKRLNTYVLNLDIQSDCFLLHFNWLLFSCFVAFLTVRGLDQSVQWLLIYISKFEPTFGSTDEEVLLEVDVVEVA
jgi:hypothetical protein